MMKYTRTSWVLRLIPFLAFLDCFSTLIGLSFGGKEAFALPAFFIDNWGNGGLVSYAIIVFLILQLISEFLIIRPLRTAEGKPRIFLFSSFLTVILYYAGASYWLSIVVINFLLPIDLGRFGAFLPWIILLLSSFSFFSYTRTELMSLMRNL